MESSARHGGVRIVCGVRRNLRGQEGQGLKHEEYVQMYLDESRELLHTLDDLCLQLDRGTPREDTFQQMFRAAHTLKGSAAFFSPSAAEAARALEQHGRAGDLAPAPAARARLAGEVERLQVALATMLKEEGA